MKRLVKTVWFWALLMTVNLTPALSPAAEKVDPKALFEARYGIVPPSLPAPSLQAGATAGRGIARVARPVRP